MKPTILLLAATFLIGGCATSSPEPRSKEEKEAAERRYLASLDRELRHRNAQENGGFSTISPH